MRSPDELYDRPRTLFVAGFVSNPPMNFLDVEVVSEDGSYHARRYGFDMILSSDRGEKAAGKGKVVLGIRPEDVTIADGGLAGEVSVGEPLGRESLVDVRVGKTSFLLLSDPKVYLKPGQKVTIHCDPDKVQLFDPETEKSLLWN